MLSPFTSGHAVRLREWGVQHQSWCGMVLPSLAEGEPGPMECIA